MRCQPDEVLSDGITDAQLAAQAGHASAGLQSAELTALESLGDDEVRQALAQLREDQRLVVYYADVKSCGTRTCAELILDIPEGTVMSRLHRGRRALCALLVDVATDRGYLSGACAA